MNPRIKKQIIAIQESGLTNMLDTNYVQRLAHERNFFELVIFIEDHKKEYVHFIMTEMNLMWTNGVIKIDKTNVTFSVKHFEEPSEFGIDEGCISKLELRVKGKIVADYDRGWDIEPSDAAVEKALQYVLATYN